MSGTPPRARWMDSPAQVVFDDTHVRVMFKPGGSDLLLLTFGNAEALAQGTRFYADTLVGKYGINCLGFMAHAANWFPADSMRQAVRSLGYTLAAFRTRLAYGSSLGAYAAIKHSALLGATHVVAFCPQWSIDPAECGAQDSGFRNFYRPEMAGMGLRAQDMAGDITIFYDPGAPTDRYHFDRIRGIAAGAAQCRVRSCHVHNVRHHVAPALAGSHLAVSLFRACLDGRTDSLYGLIATKRRASLQRRRTVLAAAVARHPRMALRAFAALARAGQAGMLDGTNCLARLHRALRASPHPDLARELVGVLLPHVLPVRAALLRGSAGQKAAALTSVHGGTLCYSALGRCLVHVAWPDEDGVPGLCPVGTDEAGRLCLVSGGQTYFCRSLDHEVTEPTTEPEGCFEARQADGGFVTFVAAERYLTALPNGTVCRLESEAGNWEVFSRT